MALVILCVVSTMTPVAPHPAAHPSNLQLEQASRMLVPSCLTSLHPACAVLGLQPSLSPVDQPAVESCTGCRTWSQPPVYVEFQVPEGLVQSLLREERLIRPVERQISAVLPHVFSSEEWVQKP